MTYSSAVFEHDGQTLADAQRAKYRTPGRRRRPAPRDARPRDRLRVGRVRAVRRGRAGLPGHDRSRSRPSSTTSPVRGSARPGSRTGSTSSCATTATSRAPTTRSSRSRCSRRSAPSTTPTYFRAVDRALRPGGRFALQVITFPDVAYEAQRRGANWIQTYIFPGGLCPSLAVIERSLHGTRLLLREARDIAPSYVRTLAAWRERVPRPRRRRPGARLRRAVHPDVGLLPRALAGRLRDRPAQDLQIAMEKAAGLDRVAAGDELVRGAHPGHAAAQDDDGRHRAWTIPAIDMATSLWRPADARLHVTEPGQASSALASPSDRRAEAAAEQQERRAQQEQRPEQRPGRQGRRPGQQERRPELPGRRPSLRERLRSP